MLAVVRVVLVCAGVLVTLSVSVASRAVAVCVARRVRGGLAERRGEIEDRQVSVRVVAVGVLRARSVVVVLVAALVVVCVRVVVVHRRVCVVQLRRRGGVLVGGCRGRDSWLMLQPLQVPGGDVVVAAEHGELALALQRLQHLAARAGLC